MKGRPLVSPLSDAPDAPRPAVARPEAVVVGSSTAEGRCRFTVLTSRLIRMELSPTGVFTDAATQLVVNRDLGEPPSFRVVRGEDRLEIITEHLHLTHVPSLGFSSSGLSVRLRSTALHAHGGTWHHGDVWDPQEAFPTNLGGTTRTLDEADGAVRLDPGLLSLSGITALDDSSSLLLTEDEWVRPREPGNRLGDGAQDLYVFGYGQDYRQALRDFFNLTGPSPLIPRALLGNWWSRYHPYSAREYLALMDHFAAEELPFSVAVIDMDWHLTDIDPAIGTGWTGYTWNRELFPDPRAFLEGLHERGMLTTLNVHPAQGVRRHEEAYEEVCADLGLDAAGGQDVPFNVADRDFMGSYLSRLHHRLEDEGVDFWWLDWQQGGSTTVPGLDPLWMLNHVHYLDSGRERPVASGGVERRRPVTFSRFADASSHRTPVGFSGDTIISWASLRFQPRFTATAANIGYFWWSNDIGGHMLGTSDDAMAARWFQLGCFSPINRLHSSNSAFTSKEPWRYSRDARATMEAHLRLRHRLVPYLYTWARRSVSEGVGPVRPLYHDHPREMSSYEHRNSFCFGDLLVVPFTSPLDEATGLGREMTWLPDGVWYDLPTGRRYEATTGGHGRMLSLSRPLDRIGVLARAGSVIPLAGSLTEAAGDNPRELEVVVVPGGSGSFTLEEDDGSADPGSDRVARTRMELTWPDAEDGGGSGGTGDTGDVVLRIRLEGADEVVPDLRLVTVRLLACRVSDALLRVAGQARRLTTQEVDGDGFTLGAGTLVHLGELSRQELADGVGLVLRGVEQSPADWRGEVHEILDAARVAYAAKDQAWGAVQRGLDGTALLGELESLGLPETLRSAVAEVLPH
ncbi:Alpha-xylosidase [Actinomyces viscosus]|uniref:Alpha-xylosidase n=1 Tax=Actinomyces viscosus TaxID=1656 RepID=A0A3S4Z1R7_ACTVI|nr:Alpha-xylosidase [Actinomyces viscosus]